MFGSTSSNCAWNIRYHRAFARAHTHTHAHTHRDNNNNKIITTTKKPNKIKETQSQSISN